MGTAVRPAKTPSGPWDAFADVDVFVDEVLVELEAMARDGDRPLRSGPKPPLAGAALRKAVMAIWLSLSRLNHQLPRPQTHPEIMQRTADFHHQIADALLPQPNPIFDDATALDTTIDMLNPKTALIQ